MNNQAFLQLLEIFQLTRLKFYLQLQQDIYLPSYTGATIHGFLGYALQRYKPHINTALYKKNDSSYDIRPYAIVDNTNNHHTVHKGRGHLWKKGEVFNFELKLFGNKTQYAQEIIEAISSYGLSFGIGGKDPHSGSKYHLLSVHSVCRDRHQTGVHTHTLAEHINPSLLNVESSIQNIDVQLNSLLKLQHRNQLLKNTAPELQKILKQIYLRTKHLCLSHQTDNSEWVNAVEKTVPKDFFSINNSQVNYLTWQRKKDHNDEVLDLSGINGLLRYQLMGNDASKIVPWLAVGQLLQIGGKTTFGLGDYTLIC